MLMYKLILDLDLEVRTPKQITLLDETNRDSILDESSYIDGVMWF